MTKINQTAVFYVCLLYCLSFPLASAQQREFFVCYSDEVLAEQLGPEVTDAGRSALKASCKLFADRVLIPLPPKADPVNFRGDADTTMIESDDGIRWFLRVWPETGANAALKADDLSAVVSGASFGEALLPVGGFSELLKQGSNEILDSGTGERFISVSPADGVVLVTELQLSDDRGGPIPFLTTITTTYKGVNGSKIETEEDIEIVNESGDSVQKIQTEVSSNLKNRVPLDKLADIGEDGIFITNTSTVETITTPGLPTSIHSIDKIHTPPHLSILNELSLGKSWYTAPVAVATTRTSLGVSEPIEIKNSDTSPSNKTVTAINTPVGEFITYETLEVYPGGFSFQHVDMQAGVPVLRSEYKNNLDDPGAMYGISHVGTSRAIEVNLPKNPKPLDTLDNNGNVPQNFEMSGGMVVNGAPGYVQQARIGENDTVDKITFEIRQPEDEGKVAAILLVFADLETGVLFGVDSTGQVSPFDAEDLFDPTFFVKTITLQKSDTIEFGAEVVTPVLGALPPELGKNGWGVHAGTRNGRSSKFNSEGLVIHLLDNTAF